MIPVLLWVGWLSAAMPKLAFLSQISPRLSTLRIASANRARSPIVPSNPLSRSRSPRTGVSAVLPMRRRPEPRPWRGTRTAPLIIGDVPGETLRITGPWSYGGDIYVVGDGVLEVRRATFALGGNLWVMDSGTVRMESSRVEILQAYPYQWAWVVMGKGSLVLKGDTTAFSGHSAMFWVGDSAFYAESSVVNLDWTTMGVAGRGGVNLHQVRLAGEFVVQHETNVRFSRVDTVLIWFHLPRGGTLQVTFPPGDTLYGFVLDSTLSGISGVSYRVQVDTCRGVWWGLMPEESTFVELTQSRMRTVGLWWTDSTLSQVSGLVNAQMYTDQWLPLTDRTFHLVNTYVETWSLYPMQRAHVQVHNSILGEVLPQQQATVELTNSMVDGTGGYLGATGASLLFAYQASVLSTVRSEDSAVLVYAYSATPGPIGEIYAMDRSVLAVVQVPGVFPPAYDTSVVVGVRIDGPDRAPAGQPVAFTGGAWVDHGPFAQMSLDHYDLWIQRVGDTGWTVVDTGVAQEVRGGVLGIWNPGTAPPAAYWVRLVAFLPTGDSLEALSRFTLVSPVPVMEPLRGQTVRLVRTVTGWRLRGIRGKVHVVDPAGRMMAGWASSLRFHRPGVYWVETGNRRIRLWIPPHFR